jgi:hypothetical protein
MCWQNFCQVAGFAMGGWTRRQGKLFISTVKNHDITNRQEVQGKRI